MLPRFDRIALSVVAVLACLGIALSFSSPGISADGPEPVPFPFTGVKKETLARGQALWKNQCMQCHAVDGSAETVTAKLLIPQPRDFRKGVTKYKTNQRGHLSTRSDLLRVIQQGVPTTSMGSFRDLPAKDLHALAAWTEHLLLTALQKRVDASYQQSGVGPMPSTEFFWNNSQNMEVIPDTERIPLSKESVQRGAFLFQGDKVSCFTCHGKDGSGKGPASFQKSTGNYLLKDSWGKELRPHDLTEGLFRGGSAPEDLWRRIHQGIPGTPMPVYHTQLSSDDIWDLVNFILSLAKS
ncbi:MAG: cytochrome c [Planctomycetota bacterium]|nr:cytochrome c [Planctomycetota bacterium]